MKKRLMILMAIFAVAFVWKGMPTEAARIPVIKNGKQDSLKGTIINVKYKGEEVSLAADSSALAPSVKIGSTIYVPCRTLFSDNGIHAVHSKNGNKVTLRYGARKVVFYANKKYAKVNGTKMKLDVKPYFVTFQKSNVNDLLVPVEQAASFFGLKYSYNNAAKTVTLQVRPGISKTATQAEDIEKSAFIKTLGPIARENYKRTGILASVTMAQAILESGWGQSTLAQNGNNLFGMKMSLSGNTWSGSAWDGVNYYKKRTYEYGSGGRYSITAKFRKYSCVEDSIEDHSAYLLNARNGSKKRYAGLTNTKSYKRQLQIIKNGGYATSGSYVSQLSNVIRTYHLTQWDQ